MWRYRASSVAERGFRFDNYGRISFRSELCFFSKDIPMEIFTFLITSVRFQECVCRDDEHVETVLNYTRVSQKFCNILLRKFLKIISRDCCSSSCERYSL